MDKTIKDILVRKPITRELIREFALNKLSNEIESLYAQQYFDVDTNEKYYDELAEKLNIQLKNWKNIKIC